MSVQLTELYNASQAILSKIFFFNTLPHEKIVNINYYNSNSINQSINQQQRHQTGEHHAPKR